MNPSWNISLFHYRNHGADYGRILVGLQVPEQDEAEFSAFLEGLATPTGTNPSTRLPAVSGLSINYTGQKPWAALL